MKPQPAANYASSRLLIGWWLWSLAGLVLAMILLGGATRLTDSGLSITEWQPLVGTIPPLSEAEWIEAFEKYKQIPEYRLVNANMSLAEFKVLYWWEWAHRFLGRVIGVALIGPFLALVATRRIEPPLIKSLLMLLVLGALQAALGWYMVQSGLSDRTDVSQYRLAAHLMLAALIYAAIIWVALGVGLRRRRIETGEAAVSLAIIVLIFLQLGAGGLVAGLDAGLSHNTFPLMDGRLIPEGLLVIKPWWRNFFENPLTVQFVHRATAYLVTIVIWLHAMGLTRSGRNGAREISAWVIAIAVAVQMGLGVWALLTGVPLYLGLLHQGGAMLLLTISVVHLHLVVRQI
jgi:cytochrome c oxidase assembly protein subunit 15